MRTLFDIIELVKDGDKPEYDELRYAVVALSALRHFDSDALRKIAKRESEGKPPLSQYYAEESFKRFKAALLIDPKSYCGPQHDPDTEECQKFRKMAKGILKHVTK